MNELKKCPFCGGNNVSLWYNRSISPLIPTTCEVHCYDCHFGLAPSKTKEEAIKAWNNRKPAEEVVARLEECSKSHFNYWDEFDDEYSFGSMNAYMNAIAIVKEGMG